MEIRKFLHISRKREFFGRVFQIYVLYIRRYTFQGTIPCSVWWRLFLIMRLEVQLHAHDNSKLGHTWTHFCLGKISLYNKGDVFSVNNHQMYDWINLRTRLCNISFESWIVVIKSIMVIPERLFLFLCPSYAWADTGPILFIPAIRISSGEEACQLKHSTFFHSKMSRRTE